MSSKSGAARCASTSIARCWRGRGIVARTSSPRARFRTTTREVDTSRVVVFLWPYSCSHPLTAYGQSDERRIAGGRRCGAHGLPDAGALPQSDDTDGRDRRASPQLPGAQPRRYAGISQQHDQLSRRLQRRTVRGVYPFCRRRVGASAGGERGQHGGSITRSHAFGPRFRTAEIYRQRYGEQLVKDEIHSVFWKESYRTTRFIRENQVDLPALLTRNEKLRFLMPIRYPLDCARSSLKSGHAIAFVDEDEPQPMRPLVAAILDQIVWFFQWQDRFPDRFFWFSENGFEQSTVEALAAFLSVDAEPRWCDSALDAFEVERRYEYRPAMIEYYHQTVQDKLGDRPQIAERLMKMAAGRARGE